MIYACTFNLELNHLTMLYEYSFWGIGERFLFMSSEPIERGDTVEIQKIEGNQVLLSKVDGEAERVLLNVTTTIPFGEGSDVQFRYDKTSVEVLNSIKAERNGNTVFLVLLGVTPNVRHKIRGIISNTKTEFDFIVFSVLTRE